MNIDSLITISSPTSGKIIMESLSSNPINEWLSKYMASHFVAHVKENLDMIKKVSIFEKNPNRLDHALESKTIKEILERFDVPMFGFETMDQFFASVSVIGRLNTIDVPVTMLHAEDDPIAPIDCMYAFFTISIVHYFIKSTLLFL